MHEVYIGHSEKYHNALCLSPQILHKHCFQFLLGLTMVTRENKNNAYAKFGGTNKEYYGIFRNAQLTLGSKFINVTGLTLSKRTCQTHGWRETNKKSETREHHTITKP